MAEVDYRFCPKCGGNLVERLREGRRRLVCGRCGFVFYRNPTPAVAVVLMNNRREILLVRRKFEPRAGDWTLPAGFIESDEDIERAALREVKEETNLDIQLGEILGVYSGFDDPRNPVLLVVYRGQILGGDLQPGDDAVEAAFFPLDETPANIAFQTHKKVLENLKENESAR